MHTVLEHLAGGGGGRARIIPAGGLAPASSAGSPCYTALDHGQVPMDCPGPNHHFPTLRGVDWAAAHLLSPSLAPRTCPKPPAGITEQTLGESGDPFCVWPLRH